MLDLRISTISGRTAERDPNDNYDRHKYHLKGQRVLLSLGRKSLLIPLRVCVSKPICAPCVGRKHLRRRWFLVRSAKCTTLRPGLKSRRPLDNDLARAYSSYADAIDARIAAGVMERVSFFKLIAELSLPHSLIWT